MKMVKPLDMPSIGFFESGRHRELLCSGLWGFEREALRVDAQGRPAATEHPFPPGRGDITVDFAENQIELVTRPRASLEMAFDELKSLHSQAYAGIGYELLWPLSVPGRWDEPERIKPASFGLSPEREESRIYRQALLARYGRARQAITGLHYNFSFSRGFWRRLGQAEGPIEDPLDFANRRYMDLARNFVRYSFLPIFLFSSSPMIDGRFFRDLECGVEPGPLALGRACAGNSASLRLGPLGYRLGEKTSRSIDIRFESLTEYLSKLSAALLPSRGRAPALGSEGEFYAPVRPKAAYAGKKASLEALRARGIEYLEFRVFDLDPFESLGIGQEAARFTHLFALACLFAPSPSLGRAITADDPLSLVASTCSLGAGDSAADARVSAAVGRAAGPILEAMGRIARLLPPEYGHALSWARELLVGRTARSAEKFMALSRGRGGALAAGLELAREHRSALMGETLGGRADSKEERYGFPEPWL